MKNKLHSRIENIFTFWFTNYSYQFHQDESLLDMSEGFIKQFLSNEELPKLLIEVKESYHGGEIWKIERKKKTNKVKTLHHHRKNKSLFDFSEITKTPGRTFTSTLGDSFSDILHVSAKTLAQTLCAYEHILLKAITPNELLFGNFKKKNKETLSPNVCALINWFNRMSNWVLSEIITRPNIRQRAAVLNLFIETSMKCYKYHNYNAVFEIMSSIKQTPVSRLKNTMKCITKKNSKNFEILDYAMCPEQNNSVLRKILGELVIAKEVPCIPYIGIYLQDLLLIEELNTKEDENGLYNFKKFRRTAEIIKNFSRFSETKYEDFLYDYGNPIIHYILSYHLIENTKEQYKYSHQCEPKTSE